MCGGEIYVKKIPSMRILDIAKTINPAAKIKFVGIRPGEKLHEQMIGLEDAPYTYEYDKYFKILPMIHNWNADPLRIKDGVKVDESFVYSSNTNPLWMDVEDLKKWILKK